MKDASKETIAVSACLLGHPCRYDGASKPHEGVIALSERYNLLPICPEVEGGLPIPHPPCEIVRTDACFKVIDIHGSDVTEQFTSGARICCQKVSAVGCKRAILKAKSPSCGSGMIYDGSFTGNLIPGWGVAAAAIRNSGVAVFDETQLAQLDS